LRADVPSIQREAYQSKVRSPAGAETEKRRAFEVGRCIPRRTSPIVFFTTGEFISTREVLLFLDHRMVQKFKEGLATRINTHVLADQASAGFKL
jgi:hypothetical protein